MIFLAGIGDVLSGVAPFETRRARETVWEVIEGLEEAKDDVTCTLEAR